MEPLFEALRAQETHRQELIAAQAEADVPAIRPRDLRQQLERYLDDWSRLLRANATQGQQALGRLIDGRLTFTLLDGHYEFQGRGTVEPLLGGLVQDWRPQGDSNPCCRLNGARAAFALSPALHHPHLPLRGRIPSRPAKSRMAVMGDSKRPDELHAAAGTVSDPGPSKTAELELDLEGAFSDDGVDLTLIRWMLRRTPTERLQAAQELIDATWALRTDSET